MRGTFCSKLPLPFLDAICLRIEVDAYKIDPTHGLMEH